MAHDPGRDRPGAAAWKRHRRSPDSADADHALQRDVPSDGAAHWETEVDSIDLDLAWLPAQRDVQLATGVVREGNSVATIWTWSVQMTNGLKVTHKSHWYVDPIPGWDRRNVWIVDLVGEPQLRTEMVLEAIGPDALTAGGYDPNGRALAALCINAMPEVHRAPPGILKPVIFAPWRGRLQ
jgi:2,4-diaminopentanoate dehydrogenase